MTTAPGTKNGRITFHDFDLGIFLLEQVHDFRPDILRQIHIKPFAIVNAAVVIERQNEPRHLRLTSDIANVFCFFADAGGDDLFNDSVEFNESSRSRRR